METATGRVEKLNQAVRGVVTLVLVGTTCYGFIMDKISSEAFVGIVSGVITFWFATRGGQNPVAPPSPAAPANGGPDAPKP